MKKFTILILLFLVSTASIIAEETSEEPANIFFSQHQIGLRIGGWVNQGILPSAADTSDDGAITRSKISDNSFYLEGYYGLKLIPQLFAEFSLGIVNRGTITFDDNTRRDVGNLLVYPILIKLKAYPLKSLRSKLAPYLTVGGGLYYSRQSVQFTTSYYSQYLNEKSATNFNLTFGGGFDYILNNTIGIELNTSYFPINFSKPFIGVNDYNAFTITVGVKYLYQNKK